MAVTFINGFLTNTGQIEKSTDATALNVQRGTLVTDLNGSLKARLQDGTDQVLISAIAAGSTIETICSNSDWEDKAASFTSTEIILKDNTTYLLCEATTIAKTLVFANNASIKDLTAGSNPITITADPMLKATAMTRCRFQNVQFNGNLTNTVFDFTGVGAPNSGFLSCELVVFALAADMGTLTGVQPVWNGVAIVFVGGGLTITGTAGLSSIVSLNWFNATDFTQFTVDGTWGGIVLFDRLNLSTGASGIAFDVDSAITAPSIFFNTIAYTGGTFFDATGLDKTDDPIDVNDVQTITDSTVIGELFMNSNATVTDIVTQDVPVLLAGTTTGGTVERMTATNQTLTYNGTKTIIAEVEAEIQVTVDVATEGEQYTMYIAIDGVVQTNTAFTQTFGTAIGIAPISPIFKPAGYLSVDTGETIQVFVESNSGIVDITATSMKMRAKVVA